MRVSPICSESNGRFPYEAGLKNQSPCIAAVYRRNGMRHTLALENVYAGEVGARGAPKEE